MLDQLLADIDDLLDLYHFLVDTGAILDLDITGCERWTAEKENDDTHRGG